MATSFLASLIAGVWPDWSSPASLPQLPEYMLCKHATAAEPCSLIHHLQKSILGFLADDNYVSHVNHQLATVEFLFGFLPYCPQLRNPWCD
jgi:hypothetical protein